MATLWGMGLHWGRPVCNNKSGHMISHIKDIGVKDYELHKTRLSTTCAAQPYHNDASDLVALLCLHNAKKGGGSHWASAVSVYNEIVRRRPDLAELLTQPWYYDKKGENSGEGRLPYMVMPVFSLYGGSFTVNFSVDYIKLAQRFEEVPRMGDAHREALELIKELVESPELRMDHILQPGDVQLLSNHTCLHSREAFEDHLDVTKRRHLVRLWLAPADERELDPAYPDLFEMREGVIAEGKAPFVPLDV